MKQDEGLSVSFLVEDSVHRTELFAEHGLSAFVEREGKGVLFDTGQSDLLFRNAKIMGIELGGVMKIALSHGHYDHTGGLLEVLRHAPKAPVCAHPALFGPKFYREKDGAWRKIGIPFSQKEVEESCFSLSLETSPQEIAPGIFLTGEIPRKADFEEPASRFFAAENDEKKPDLLLDDQALIADTPTGLVVILGCAHAGVVNTLHHVARLFPRRQIALVAGGMHLLDSAAERIRQTVEALRELGVRRVVAGHCTGWKACCVLSRVFADSFWPLEAGMVLKQGDSR